MLVLATAETNVGTPIRIKREKETKKGEKKEEPEKNIGKCPLFTSSRDDVDGKRETKTE